MDFTQMKPYKPHHFVPDGGDFTDPAEVEALYKRLLKQEINSSDDLSQWVRDRSEMEAAMDQQGSILYIQMTCQTDNASYAQKYTQYIETVAPIMKKLDYELNLKYISSLKSFPLDEERYFVYSRGIQAELDLFVEKNIPLQTKIQLLSQEYQTVTGAMTVNFEGREQTMPEMQKYLLSPERQKRQAAWQHMSERRFKERNKLNDLFDKMVALRHQVALNAGDEDFSAYMFKALQRFDYTADDCRTYHKVVEKHIVPLWAKIIDRRKKNLNISSLRPWDTAVDPFNRAPLKPFDDINDLIKGCAAIFNRVHKDLGGQFETMSQEKLLDLASRKGKAPGGYQSSLADARKPFIFMNAVGTDDDVRTLLHEGGHAFHSMACVEEEIYHYRHAPMEFCEVASMSMELLGNDFLDVFYACQ